MKLVKLLTQMTVLGILPAATLTAQTALPYRVLVLENGKSDIKDGSLSGNIVYSNRTENKIKDVSPLDGTVYVHSNVRRFDTAGLYAPTGGTFESGFDSQIGQTNIEALAMGMYAASQSADQSFDRIDNNDFSYTSTKSLTVLDFKEIKMDQNTFSLVGRSGENDQFIIRLERDLNFKKSLVNLTNIDSADVLWYFGNRNKAEIMHGRPLSEGSAGFSGTVYNANGEIRLGSEGPFDGTIIGGNITMGSGFSFTTVVPEPASSALLVVGTAAMIFRRRRS